MAELSAKIHMDSSEVDAAVAKLRELDTLVDDLQSRLAALRASASRTLTLVAEGNAALAQQAEKLAELQKLAATTAPDPILTCAQCGVSGRASDSLLNWWRVIGGDYCFACYHNPRPPDVPDRERKGR